MSFKVGDRVRAIRPVQSNTKIVNQTGTIISTEGAWQKYGVEFDKHINGHSCGGIGKNHYCWWVDGSDIEPVTEFKVGQIYKVGENRFECGNIIEITNVFGDNIGYKTLKGKTAGSSWFDKNSPFAKSLKLINGCENKIVITTDGVTTTAKMYDGKNVVKTATAKCSPDDEFNFETGARIAFDRLNKKDFNWDGFKRGEFVVHVKTQEEYDTFMKMCEEHELRWANGFNPTQNNMFSNVVSTCIKGEDKHLTYATSDYFEEQGYKIVEFNPSTDIVKEMIAKRIEEVGRLLEICKSKLGGI